MIKLIAIDMDGTLLNSKKELPQENIAALQAATARGVKIVLCTGRPLVGVKPYFDQLGLTEDEFVIVNNGCTTYRTKDWTIIDQEVLSVADIEGLYQLTDEDVQLTVFDEDDYLVVEEAPSDLVTYDASLVFTQPKTITLAELKHSQKPYFEAMFLGDKDDLDYFQDCYNDQLAQDFSVVRSQDYIFEVLPQGVTKASALRKLACKLGYSRREIMAIGDANNDMEMLAYAEYSVAMGNSPAHIKSAAKYNTLSNDRAGVARIIEELVLRKM